MARYEFSFVVSDVELSEIEQERVGRAIAQSGALAMGNALPPSSLALPGGVRRWWIGIPPVELTKLINETVPEVAKFE
jgi:hypothetical protein